MVKHVTVVITKNGEVTIDFEGFKGRSCVLERQKIIRILETYGVKVNIEDEVKKPEYYEVSVTVKEVE